ncbi:MAG: amino acid racemase [Oscillospiraceae bacterium]|nr:amino acid racemase [Oscillospiraceae bacterium]
MYKKLGILGGMGPLATSRLYSEIIKSSRVKRDQDHIDMVILNASYIPDRTEAILHKGESALPYLLNALKTLENCGCDLIAIPCNTSHYYFDELQNNCKIKILNMIDLTAEILKNLGVTQTYLMATEGTVKTGVYQKYLGKKNIKIISPTDEETKEMMRVIYKIKAGVNPDLSKLEEIARHYDKLNILGCTELSTVKFRNIKYIDSMEILKDKILELFGIKKSI